MSCKYTNEQQHLPRNFTKRTVSWIAQTNRLTSSNLSKWFIWEKTKCVFDYCLSLLKLCYNMAIQCEIVFLLRVEKTKSCWAKTSRRCCGWTKRVLCFSCSQQLVCGLSIFWGMCGMCWSGSHHSAIMGS